MVINAFVVAKAMAINISLDGKNDVDKCAVSGRNKKYVRANTF